MNLAAQWERRLRLLLPTGTVVKGLSETGMLTTVRCNCLTCGAYGRRLNEAPKGSLLSIDPTPREKSRGLQRWLRCAVLAILTSTDSWLGLTRLFQAFNELVKTCFEATRDGQPRTARQRKVGRLYKLPAPRPSTPRAVGAPHWRDDPKRNAPAAAWACRKHAWSRFWRPHRAKLNVQMGGPTLVASIHTAPVTVFITHGGATRLHWAKLEGRLLSTSGTSDIRVSGDHLQAVARLLRRAHAGGFGSAPTPDGGARLLDDCASSDSSESDAEPEAERVCHPGYPTPVGDGPEPVAA